MTVCPLLKLHRENPTHHHKVQHRKIHVQIDRVRPQNPEANRASSGQRPLTTSTTLLMASEINRTIGFDFSLSGIPWMQIHTATREEDDSGSMVDCLMDTLKL